MDKIEVTCACGRFFIIKNNEIKRCPGCGRPHRGHKAPKEYIVKMN
jgi:hypothetical protein